MALALACGARAGGPRDGLPLDPAWAATEVWDDGLAEIATYEAARVIYREVRPYELVLITVKEDLDARSLVKADPPYGDRPRIAVLKQNAVREIPTPNYPYRIMTSTFVEREDPARLVRLTSGAHEWCGNTWKALRRNGGTWLHTWESYFDGEADGRQELIAGPADLVADQLPLAFRGLAFEPGLSARLRLLPSFATTHGGPVRWIEAELSVAGRERLGLPAGSFEAWKVQLSAARGYEMTLWFAVEGTHPLLQLETSEGERWRLAAIERRAYWLPQAGP